MSTAEPEWLPDFPTDEATLARLEEAINTSIAHDDQGERIKVGGDFTLSEYLDFMSGYDPTLAIPDGTMVGPLGEQVEVVEYPFPCYHPNDVIRALINALRGTRFRVDVACDGYANLTDNDVPEDVDEEGYLRGAAAAAEGIRSVLNPADRTEGS